ncbi:hypothetical protein LguiA_001610 [Lonicera macranthoides]
MSDNLKYRMTGQLSPKSGVYNFGVILLELLTGREPVDHVEYGQKSLVAWATPKIRKDKLKRCIDPRLKGDFHPGQAAKMANLAILCVSIISIVTKEMTDVDLQMAALAFLCLQYESYFRPNMRMLMQQQNDKQAINIQPIAIPCVQLDELKEITYNFGTNA